VNFDDGSMEYALRAKVRTLEAACATKDAKIAQLKVQSEQTESALRAVGLNLRSVMAHGNLLKERLGAAEAECQRLRDQLAALAKLRRHRVHIERENDDPCSPIVYVACPPDADGPWVSVKDVLAALSSQETT
jgi:hypothetical protein